MLHAARPRPETALPVDRIARFGSGRPGLAEARPHGSLPQLVAELAAVHGPAPAFADPDGGASYAELGAALARYARYARAEGVGPGDTVALLMRERAERHALWLGFALAGARVALIAPETSGPRLAQALAATGARLLVADPDRAAALRGLAARLPEMPAVRWHGPGADFARIDREAAEYEATAFADAVRPGPDEPALLVCLEARGGAPALAAASHRQLLVWAHGASLGIARACPAEFRALAETCGTLLRGATVVIGPGVRAGAR